MHFNLQRHQQQREQNRFVYAVSSHKVSSHTNKLGLDGARRRRSGGGLGGGCGRMPAGIPSPPRGGRLNPRSRAKLGTVGG
jgi:hypothetical protein